MPLQLKTPESAAWHTVQKILHAFSTVELMVEVDALDYIYRLCCSVKDGEVPEPEVFKQKIKTGWFSETEKTVHSLNTLLEWRDDIGVEYDEVQEFWLLQDLEVKNYWSPEKRVREKGLKCWSCPATLDEIKDKLSPSPDKTVLDMIRHLKSVKQDFAETDWKMFGDKSDEAKALFNELISKAEQAVELLGEDDNDG